MTRRTIFSAVLLVTAVRLAIAQSLQPPVAEVKPVRFEEHGRLRVDNYYWLRERENSKVLDYLRAENAYTDAVMADTKPLEEKLYRETIARIKQDDSSVPYLDNGYEYYTRFEEGKQYPLYCRRLPQDRRSSPAWMSSGRHLRCATSPECAGRSIAGWDRYRRMRCAPHKADRCGSALPRCRREPRRQPGRRGA